MLGGMTRVTLPPSAPYPTAPPPCAPYAYATLPGEADSSLNLRTHANVAANAAY